MESDGDNGHPFEMIWGTECEESVAGEPAEDTDSEHPFDAESAEEKGDEEHEKDFGDLAESHDEADAFGEEADDWEVNGSESVIVSEGDADESGAEDEDEEGGFGEEFKGIDHEDSVEVEGFAFSWGWSVWEEKREEAHEDSRATGEVENGGLGGGAEGGEEPTGGDPADRAEDANFGEFILVLDVGEGDGIGQAHGGHVAEHMEIEERDNGLGGRALGIWRQVRESGDATGDHEHESGAEEVEQTEDALGGEKAIGDEAEEEWGDDGGDGLGGVGLADDRAELVIFQATAHGGEPRAPDEELEEHHHGEAGDDGILRCGGGHGVGCWDGDAGEFGELFGGVFGGFGGERIGPDLADHVKEHEATDDENSGEDPGGFEAGRIADGVEEIADGEEGRPDEGAPGDPAEDRGADLIFFVDFLWGDSRFGADGVPAWAGDFDLAIKGDESLAIGLRSEESGEDPGSGGDADLDDGDSGEVGVGEAEWDDEGGDEGHGHGDDFGPSGDAPPEPAGDVDEAGAGADGEEDLEGLLGGGHEEAEDGGDAVEEDGGDAAGVDVVGFGFMGVDEAPIEIVNEVRGTPIEVGEDGGRIGGDEATDHEADEADGEEFEHGGESGIVAD